MSPVRVLLVEDSIADATLVERTLRWVDRDLVLHRVRDEWQMRAELAGGEWDVIVSDLVLPTFSGLAALGVAQESGLDVPFILLSGVVGEGAALAALRAGAHDFLSKADLSRLPAVVERELREAAARSGRRAADAELAALHAGLAREAERHAHVLDALHDLAMACGDRTDEEGLASAATRQAGRLVEADAGLGLRDPATGRWLFATSRDRPWRSEREPAPEGVLVAAAARGETSVVTGPCQVLPLRSGRMVSAASACALPLPGVEGAIGGLAAWSAVHRDFGRDDVVRLEVVAALAAPALESIRLVREAREQAPRR
jgi:FixJ family two-component response regulator